MEMCREYETLTEIKPTFLLHPYRKGYTIAKWPANTRECNGIMERFVAELGEGVLTNE
jgi:hypothetical protein